eukprot:366029-Chlamydomonas_euryale.AAC.46
MACRGGGGGAAHERAGGGAGGSSSSCSTHHAGHPLPPTEQIRQRPHRVARNRGARGSQARRVRRRRGAPRVWGASMQAASRHTSKGNPAGVVWSSAATRRPVEKTRWPLRLARTAAATGSHFPFPSRHAAATQCTHRRLLKTQRDGAVDALGSASCNAPATGGQFKELLPQQHAPHLT